MASVVSSSCLANLTEKFLDRWPSLEFACFTSAILLRIHQSFYSTEPLYPSVSRYRELGP